MENVLKKIEVIENDVKEYKKMTQKLLDKMKEEERKFKVRMINETIEYAKQQLEKNIEKIKNSSVNIDKYYSGLFKHIKILLNGSKKGLIILGRKGIGKTYNTIRYLEKNGYSINRNYIIIRGHITPLTLFKKLYYNKDKLIILDDIPNLFKNEDVIAILLSALDTTTNGYVEWNTNSTFISDIPSVFSFSGKIIFIVNKLPEKESLKDYIEAIKDRTIVYRLKFTNKEILEMVYIIAKEKGIPLEICDFFKDMIDRHLLLENFSLRTLTFAYDVYKNFKNEWKDIILKNNHIAIDNETILILDLLKKHNKIEKVCKEWCNLTGYSRRTFYRRLKKIKQEIDIDILNR